MTISRRTAHRLVREGKAREEGSLVPDEQGREYVILTRFDLMRTDHYLGTGKDIRRIERREQ